MTLAGLAGAMYGRKDQRSGCSQWWKRMGPEMALGFMAGLKGHAMQHFGNASAMVTMINQLRSKGWPCQTPKGGTNPLKSLKLVTSEEL